MKKIVFIIMFTIFACIVCNAENGMELIVEPGEHWQGRNPQFASWIEDNKGNYISTIVVTNKTAKKFQIFTAPKEGRPEATPVWNHKIKNDKIDAVSMATPKDGVKTLINNSLLVNGDTYNIYLEINNSFDYNDFWPEKSTGVNGQPSLIYHAKFIAGEPQGKINLVLIGHGSVDASNGNITNKTENLTTALTIIKEAYIK